MTDPIGTTIDAHTVELGSTVSINLERQPVLGVPGFILNPDHPTGVVPADLSQPSLAMLRKALDAGLITMSSKPIGAPVPAPVADINEVFTLIDGVNGRSELPHAFAEVQRKFLPKFQGMTLSQMMRQIVEHEASHQCRDEIINWFMHALDKTGGITEVSYDEIDDTQQVVFAKSGADQKDIDALREVGAAPKVETVNEKELEELF